MLSVDLRRIHDHLKGYGLQSTDDLMAAEMACLNFFPNHIRGVLDRVLSTDTALDRLAGQGWSYVNKPIYDLLTSRAAARRRPELAITSLAGLDYDLIRVRLLETDMNAEETALLFLDIPGLVRSRSQLNEAIQICRDRRSRTVYYLAGVLRKGTQRLASRTAELLENRTEVLPWTPPQDFLPAADDTIVRLGLRWDEYQRDIHLLRDPCD